MSNRTLVAFISAGGASEIYAGVVAETLRSHGHEVDMVDLKRAKTPDLSPYGAVVVGMGVRMGMVYRKGRKFLSHPDLAEKRVAVFLSSGIAIEDPEKARERFLTPLLEKAGVRPVLHDAFPGKAPGAGAKAGDTIDPSIAKRWAEDLAGRLEDRE